MKCKAENNVHLFEGAPFNFHCQSLTKKFALLPKILQ